MCEDNEIFFFARYYINSFSKEEHRPRVETNGDILHEESNNKVNIVWNLSIPLFPWLSPRAFKGSNLLTTLHPSS